ncbi:MAG TPA: hypothetical protein VK862_06605 [Afifellaceae bacterium]|nr:hypothetical protein [Afifellaceae bacterium]
MRQPTHGDIVSLFGELSDHTIVEILETRANLEQLEEAAAWLSGETDVMGEARLPLEGPAARVYDIIRRDPEFENRSGQEL